MRLHKIVALSAMLVAACASARGAEPAKTGYHVTNKYTIGGDAGWDYIVVDPEDRRVYVTHYRSVEVLDADTGKVVGRITNMNGARGVALVKSIGKGFATNGKTDSVIVVDLKTLERVGEIKAGKKPDATIYDPGTDRVFVNNGDSDDMTVTIQRPARSSRRFLSGAAPNSWRPMARARSGPICSTKARSSPSTRSRSR